MHTAQSWTNKQLPATALPLLGKLQRPRGHGDGGPGLALMRACAALQDPTLLLRSPWLLARPYVRLHAAHGMLWQSACNWTTVTCRPAALGNGAPNIAALLM